MQKAVLCLGVARRVSWQHDGALLWAQSFGSTDPSSDHRVLTSAEADKAPLLIARCARIMRRALQLSSRR